MLIDHNYDPLHSDERFPRAGYEEMVDFIVKEADLAAEALPLKQDNRNIGRVTKGAALMLKRSEEHTSELQSRQYLVCRLLLEKKKNKHPISNTRCPLARL